MVHLNIFCENWSKKVRFFFQIATSINIWLSTLIFSNSTSSWLTCTIFPSQYPSAPRKWMWVQYCPQRELVQVRTLCFVSKTNNSILATHKINQWLPKAQWSWSRTFLLKILTGDSMRSIEEPFSNWFKFIWYSLAMVSFYSEVPLDCETNKHVRVFDDDKLNSYGQHNKCAAFDDSFEHSSKLNSDNWTVMNCVHNEQNECAL